MLGVSRFLIGLGSNQMQGKRYITLYTPKYYLPLLSKIYLIIELAGFILGPFFTILMSVMLIACLIVFGIMELLYLL